MECVRRDRRTWGDGGKEREGEREGERERERERVDGNLRGLMGE